MGLKPELKARGGDSMKKLKVGMISFAHGHAYSYLNSLRAISNVEIVGIADEIKGRVEEVTTNYGYAIL